MYYIIILYLIEKETESFLLSAAAIMEIKTINIQYFATSSMEMKQDGLVHVKHLPYLSIVQATEGYYEIGIDTETPVSLKEMGGFIAPAYRVQHITHHMNPSTKRMKAHWIFLDIVVNQRYHLDEIYRFPVSIPDPYCSDVCRIIEKITQMSEICLKLSEIYQLIQILLEISFPADITDDLAFKISQYIRRNLSEKLSPGLLAQEFHISPSTLFRLFHQNFGASPSNYVNSVRLTNAMGLLETTELPISVISERLGFYDQPAFSRLFKQKYGVSPLQYRKQTKRS